MSGEPEEKKAEESALLDRVLGEIAAFEVKLEPDPTLPQLGYAYLQERLAVCRNFLNRLTYYIQTVGKIERDLKMEVRRAEMDMELKVMELLADDPVVRAQSAIDDRKAVAASKLPKENRLLGQLRLRLLEVQETMKLVRMKYRDMSQASQDIKLQRQMVKDDKDAWSEGGEGYTRPQTRKDKTVAGGLPPVVKPRVDPADLLDEKKRPADLPPPVDAVHAAQIADFFEGAPSAPAKAEREASDAPRPASREQTAGLSYEDLLRD